MFEYSLKTTSETWPTVSNSDSDLKKGVIQWKQNRTDTNEQSLEFMMGQTFDLHYTTVTERDFFQYRDKGIYSIEAINEDIWFVVHYDL